MKRLLALIPAGLLALASFLPAYAAPATSDPLLLAPKSIEKSYNASTANGTGFTTEWTYTVPNGRVLRLEQAKVLVVGAGNSALGQIQDENAPFVYVYGIGNPTVGQYITTDALQSGPVYYYAGETISGAVANSSGAAVTITVEMRGTEFNAP